MEDIELSDLRMKFSHSLQFNAVPEWAARYIAYSQLKKAAYSLQRQQVQSPDGLQPEEAARTFQKLLDAEAAKIDAFFAVKESAILAEWRAVIDEYAEFARDFPSRPDDDEARKELRSILQHVGGARYTDLPALPNHSAAAAEVTDVPPPDAAVETTGLVSDNLRSPRGLNSPPVPGADGLDILGMSDLDVQLTHKHSLPTLFDDSDFCVTFLEALRVEKRRVLEEVFTHLSELKSYVELNRIGFTKAVKKFDKLLSTNLKTQYLPSLEERWRVFQPHTMEELTTAMSGCIELYSIFTHGRADEAKLELRTNLREKVVFERNTVWRDMIGLERKSQAAHAKLEDSELPNNIVLYLGGGRSFELPISWTFAKLLIITLTTLTLLEIDLFHDRHQNNCFALVICASLLWATEAVPLFVTSLFVPFLIVILRVLKDPETGEDLTATEASKFICSAMWSPIIMLLLGGFTLAAALSRYSLDKYACTFLLSKVPQTPANILFAIMCVSAVVASLVSNVAAPVLMYSVIQPVLNTLPEGSGFAKALVLGIALASDIAGMASPIASPQNVVALQFMDPQPNWIEWFAISIPVSLACLTVIFVFLMVYFKFGSTVIVPIKMQSDPFDSKQIYVMVVTTFTIVLWCMSSILEPILGDMGMISVLSMFFFYAPGILSGEDFNNYPWTIVILAMGGLALGKAVSVSGLLSVVASSITKTLESSELFTVLVVFGSLVLVMATFVSHTVAALISVPLIAEIGKKLPDDHSNLLVMSTAMLCSCAMGLPTSGFPNVTAIGLTDPLGKKYLDVATFIKIGVPGSIFCGAIVVTVGYIIMRILQM